MENEVKTAQDIAVELKKDVTIQVKSVSDELNEKLQTVQASVDALATAQKLQNLNTEKEGKSALVVALEAKSGDLKGRQRNQTVEVPLDVKASVDMLRGNTVANSQTLIATSGYVALPNKPKHVRDFMRIAPLSQPYLKYDRELAAEGAPAIVAEGQMKPKVSFSTEAVTATAEKIAMHYKLSTELMHDAPAFAASLQGRGREMVLNEEDAQLIYGTGTSGNIQGIYPLAAPFNANGIKVTNPQNIDVLRVAAAQARRSMYRANAILMNPDDVAELELTKDEEGRYLLPTLYSGVLPAVGRIEIIEIDAINPGEFLVGAFDLGVEIYQVESLTVKATDSNDNDFVLNKVTVVIEERLLQAVTRPSAFVKGTFAGAIATLAAVV
ncbi:phage major capsid protein [Hymenobacter canadensis]|uniref:Phage major capsid protein n=1 Tax=Hymenobacter canadensis TaxID=2999067 RepID=A0ABY7LRY5_9BACT|nr:phage major capsid protein [Hymenobacter canadensis]WBA43173.1 phage major capsid protein [Hymenobacter canadensis]